ncbi:MAG: hypothetical protein KAH01_07560 [Caldisericia bacterium]|nr:hypothetical protein [Caldisericia bacterium]
MKYFTTYFVALILVFSLCSCNNSKEYTVSFADNESEVFQYTINKNMVSELDYKQNIVTIHNLQDDSCQEVMLKSPIFKCISINEETFSTIIVEGTKTLNFLGDPLPNSTERVTYGFPVNNSTEEQISFYHGIFLSFTLSFYTEGITQSNETKTLYPITADDYYSHGEFLAGKGVYLPSDHAYKVDKMKVIENTNQYVLLMVADDDSQLLFLDFDNNEAAVLPFEKPVVSFDLSSDVLSVLLSDNEIVNLKDFSFSAENFFSISTDKKQDPLLKSNYSHCSITGIANLNNDQYYIAECANRELVILRNNLSTGEIKEVPLPDTWKSFDELQIVSNYDNSIIISSLKDKELHMVEIK